MNVEAIIDLKYQPLTIFVDFDVENHLLWIQDRKLIKYSGNN